MIRFNFRSGFKAVGLILTLFTVMAVIVFSVAVVGVSFGIEAATGLAFLWLLAIAFILAGTCYPYEFGD